MGSQQMQYSTPRHFQATMGLPIPKIENRGTTIPRQRATRKCPSSWMKIRIPRTTITETTLVRNACMIGFGLPLPRQSGPGDGWLSADLLHVMCRSLAGIRIRDAIDTATYRRWLLRLLLVIALALIVQFVWQAG